MKQPMIMTPGPTYINEEVRGAMAQPITNPDLDPGFFEFYKDTCEKLQRLLKTKNDVLILSGEGILGLEAACASLIEPGDRVLCIDNGIFGKGFGDFQKMYGAEVVYFSTDYRSEISISELEEFLQEDNAFKLATVVHCETPSGITNPIDKICPLLKQYGILTVVDSVSGIGGEKLEADKWKVDIALGGSQKCLSAPPGLSFLSVSEDAWAAMADRKTPIAGFYVNLYMWKNWYKKKWFPYTQPISDIYALNKAVELVLREGDFAKKHYKIADAVRRSLVEAGLELHAASGYSNTVTAVVMPQGISFGKLFEDMRSKHNILIAGAFDVLKDKVFRIGHMGENCKEEKVYITLKALDSVLADNGIKLKGELYKLFAQNFKF
ncbi:MAG: alanine--glyoxylate aminotransferase family protein [Clostridia bacterium]|jgi:aspartate aminotransferase-like enzyme|nr:alanine--glyoxylate aminotransferase family protein [Clostridia bacterium]